MPNGRSKAVTLENRHEYVKAYVDYYMNKVVEAQYEAFAHVSCSRIIRTVLVKHVPISTTM